MGSAGLRDAITGAVNTSVMVDYYEWEFDENPAGTTAQVRPLLTEQVEILQTHKDNYDNNPHWTAAFDLDDARYQDSPWYQVILTQEEIDADDRHSGLSLQFGAEVPVTVKTMVIADLISALLDDLLESAVREELGEPYTVGASLWPLIEVGMWDNYLRASVPTESLEQTNSTVVETVAALIASRPAEADLAQAKSALRDRYQLDRNSEIIEALLQRRHLDDALVGTPEHRLAVLDEITAADVQRYVSLFFNLDNRIELFLSAEWQDEDIGPWHVGPTSESATTRR